MNLTEAQGRGFTNPDTGDVVSLEDFIKEMLKRVVLVLAAAGLDEPIVVMLLTHNNDDKQMTVSNCPRDIVREILCDASARYDPDVLKKGETN